MLMEFYGQECPHCEAVRPLVEQLEKELGVTVERFEIWHNDENMKKYDQYATGKCMGVPFFFNDANGKHICGGGATVEKLKEWAGK